MFLIIFSRGKYSLYSVSYNHQGNNILRVNPSLLDVAIFMKYPQMSENVTHNIPSCAIWPVFCVI